MSRRKQFVSGAREAFPRDQLSHTCANVVANPPDHISRLPFGIRQRPVLGPQYGNVGTGISAPHGHEHRGGGGEFDGQEPRPRTCEVDVHIAHQKFPVFLLGETPSRRSAVLSIGQEAGYIRDMLVIHRERCRRDNDLVRNG